MSADDADVLKILRIGHEVSIRGSGISLREALARTRYSELRPRFGFADLIRLVEADPELVPQWIAYSEGKRTIGGWYLLQSCEIGRVNHPESKQHFSTIDEAVAEYVLRELDFWSRYSDEC
jgi:hypothetical protein